MDHDLVAAALRVLSQYTNHGQPAEADVQVLQAHATGGGPKDIDVLAREIIRSECGRDRSGPVASTESVRRECRR